MTEEMSLMSTGIIQPPGPATSSPPPAPPPEESPPPRGHRTGTIVSVISAAVAVVALVAAALIVWSPWVETAPTAPTGVEAVPAAASVTLQWTPGEGGATVDRYLVLRDGSEVTSVPADTTTFTDTGLTPGTDYGYQVVAVAEGTESEPTASVTATTLTPSPVDVRAGTPRVGSIRITWSSPPDAPEPDRYVVLRDGEQVGSVLGGTTTYVDKDAGNGAAYEYTVAAMWNGVLSEPSEGVMGSSLKYAAPLQGTYSVTVTNTKTPGGSVEVGDDWNVTWKTTPTCSGSDCSVKLAGTLAGRSFSVTLTRQGDVYTGTTTAGITYCGPSGAGTRVTDTLQFRITPRATDDRGLWTSWKGTLTMSAPYTSVPGSSTYCPAQSWTFSLAGR